MNAIEWLLEIPKRNWEREFLIDATSGEVVTFGGLYESSLAIAADLNRRGIESGDKVAMLLSNSTDFARLYFACLYARAVAVPVNPALGLEEIQFILSHSDAKVLVVSPATLAQIQDTITNSSKTQLLVIERNGERCSLPENAESWDLSKIPPAVDFLPLAGASPDDTMTIVYTSGTTARPSGVVHRISDMIDNARMFCEYLNIGPENRFYGILAMSYLGGYYNLLMLPYAAQASVVLCRSFDGRLALNFWGPAREFGVNTLWFVPTIMSVLLETDRGNAGEAFCRENVRLALVGTAPLPLELRRKFEGRYGITLYENFALSETFFLTTNDPSQPVVDNSVGRILPGIELRISDDQGNALPAGQEGIIYVQTPYLMEGYYDHELAQAAEILQQEWFCTGDVGIIDPSGQLSITGREKDLIIRGGINISPASIENVLHQHPAVAECAVVGVPHPHYGEEVAAAVRLLDGYDFEQVQPDLMESCKQSLSDFKLPSKIVELKAFPHSSSGKIQKSGVRTFLAESQLSAAK